MTVEFTPSYRLKIIQETQAELNEEAESVFRAAVKGKLKEITAQQLVVAAQTERLNKLKDELRALEFTPPAAVEL